MESTGTREGEHHDIRKDVTVRGGRQGRKNSTHSQVELEVGILSKGRGRSYLPPPHSWSLIP